MGVYLNPSTKGFEESINSKIYVDKTGLIAEMNEHLNTEQKYVCVSRPRRFGKTMAVKMLSAYYSADNDASELFLPYIAAKTEKFERNRNRYDVVRLNMTEFISRGNTVQESLCILQERVIKELWEKYPDSKNAYQGNELTWVMQEIYRLTSGTFVILIDEWDCIFREYKDKKEEQEKYLDFLRDWLKDREYIALVYMTGILPIKKYGTHSALNMFTEYSMTNPGNLAAYFGFTSEEVEGLCQKHHMDFEDTSLWYDGYCFDNNLSIYNPRSVIQAMLTGVFDTYWNQTETFEALKSYIDMDFGGLKEAIVEMLAGRSIKIDARSFSNDMTTFHSFEDILTLLVHLGYLSYNRVTEEVSIPNKEISMEYVTAVKNTSWGEVVRAVKESEKLLQKLWNMDEGAVADGIQAAHLETSMLQYNDENALSYVVSLAFYTAREYYTIIREFPTGKGFADMVFLPRKKYSEKPAVILELKYNQSAETALEQVRDKNYTDGLKEYANNLLLVGINYNVKTKEHECRIERG